MKKLIIALGAVGLAVCAQAATVAWKVSGVTGANDDYYAYGLLASDSSGANKTIGVTAAWTLLRAGTDLYSDTVAENYDLGGATFVGTAASGADYDGGWSVGDTIKGYMIIVDNMDLSQITKYMVTAEKELTIENAGGAYSFNFGDMSAATWTDFGTAPVPEPTSGLMLLLGVAGLALKRKRA